VATIRTQLVNEQRRIITRATNDQRRVSCSCCGGPIGGNTCFLYNANDYADGLLLFDDLPQTFVLAETTFVNQESGELLLTTMEKSSSVFYFNTTPRVFAQPGEFRMSFSFGGVPLEARWIFEVYIDFLNEWVFSFSRMSCLINGNFQSRVSGLQYDEFANTYTVDWNLGSSSGSTTVTRITTACWVSEPGPNQVALYYNLPRDPNSSFVNKQVGWHWVLGDCSIATRRGGRKYPHQDSPTGNYVNPLGQINATVS